MICIFRSSSQSVKAQYNIDEFFQVTADGFLAKGQHEPNCNLFWKASILADDKFTHEIVLQDTSSRQAISKFAITYQCGQGDMQRIVRENNSPFLAIPAAQSQLTRSNAFYYN